MIVTGASSGIGRALAERAARAGWRVFAVGRRAERLDELQRSVNGATGSIATLALDIREPGAPARIVRAALEQFGRIDVVVNNAGTVAAGPITFQSDEALREQLEIHVSVPLALVREALGELRHNRGQVVFIGSGVARVPVGGLGAYPPAKAAVRNLTRIARNELRPFGIGVTYVDPGAVATEFMTRAGFSGPPSWIGASPHEVARRILDAIERRKSVVNAVPWQTIFVSLAELFPAVTDFVLTRAPQLIGSKGVAAEKSVKLLPVPDIKPEPPAKPEPPMKPEAVIKTEPVPQPQRELPEFARRLEVVPEPRQPTVEPPPVPAQAIVETQPVAESQPSAEPVAESASPSAFELALQPVELRMRRSNLPDGFVRDLLVPGTELEVGDVALRWAGMPNKHERDLTHQILEALADGGFLVRTDPNHYIAVRHADL
jgi:short-subunit dehydrogenase